MSADIAKEQESLVAARNTVMKQESAYHRKVDTENMRQALQDLKTRIKDEQKHLAEREAHLADVTARLEKATDATEKRNLKIDKKITETNITDIKTWIT